MIPFRYNAMAALLAGMVGVLLFGSAHALFIVPIWSRLGAGIPFALLAALAISWAHHELLRAGRLTPRWRDGFLFGLGIWLLFLPATGVGVLSRLTGLHVRAGSLEVIFELLAAALTGALLGALLGGPRAALSCGLAALAILATIGGPVPLTSGRRAIEIWVSLLAILGAAGIFHTLLLGRAVGRLVPPT